MRKLEREQRNARILKLYDDGLTQAQITVRLGCCAGTVSSVLLAAGRRTTSGWRRREMYGPESGSTGYRVSPHFIEHGNGHQEF